MRRRRKQPPPDRHPGPAPESSLPSLEVLEQFTRESLRQWKAAGKNLEALSHSLFFELERHRTEHASELIQAIQGGLKRGYEFSSWARIVDFRYSMQPLSMAGSVARDGGRFNIGGSLNPAAYSKFPALYVAEDFETAYRERNGIDRKKSISGLTADELILRRPGSFTYVELKGNLESFVDITDLDVLKPVAAILGSFKLPKPVLPLARAISTELEGRRIVRRDCWPLSS